MSRQKSSSVGLGKDVLEAFKFGLNSKASAHIDAAISVICKAVFVSDASSFTDKQRLQALEVLSEIIEERKNGYARRLKLVQTKVPSSVNANQTPTQHTDGRKRSTTLIKPKRR